MIIDELKKGRVTFISNEDGTESPSWTPPNALDLRAAREIERLSSVVQALANSNEELKGHYNQLAEQFNRNILNLKETLNTLELLKNNNTQIKEQDAIQK